MKIYSHTESGDQNKRKPKHYCIATDAFAVEVDPIERGSYRATAEIGTFGALTVARVDSTAAVVKRNGDVELNPALRRFGFVFVISGSLNIVHHLGMSKLNAGQFTLLDNSLPRTMLAYNQVSLLLISLPRQTLQRYLPVPEDMEALVLDDARLPEYEHLFAPVLVLWEHFRKGSLRDFAPDISDEFLASITRAYACYCKQQGSVRAQRATEARQYIEAQLGNPELTVEAIARGLGVCTRYIRFLFKDAEKPSHYILRRRLEESANQLTNILNQNVSIADIAFRCGFNSAAHFSRAFHGHYGVTPRDYRRMHLGGSEQRLASH